jgi:hypothetical protein
MQSIFIAWPTRSGMPDTLWISFTASILIIYFIQKDRKSNSLVIPACESSAYEAVWVGCPLFSLTKPAGLFSRGSVYVS